MVYKAGSGDDMTMRSGFFVLARDKVPDTVTLRGLRDRAILVSVFAL